FWLHDYAAGVDSIVSHLASNINQLKGHILTYIWVYVGANGFMIYNTVEGLCLEDSHDGPGVQLKPCQLDSASQEWSWEEGGFLANAGTLRCLSALHADPIRTTDCDGADHLQWQCANHKLISLSRSLELAADTGRLTLTKGGKANKWNSLADGDICLKKPRSRRQSEPGEFEVSDADAVHVEQTMTDKQELVRWFYRTEDSAPWTFAMLALSFIALLLGCVLVVMSMMGNRNRKKLDKYRTAAAIVKPEFEELQIVSKANEATNSYPAPMQHSHPHSRGPVGDASETEALKPGDIMVMWKDGSVSNLYPNSPGDEDSGKLCVSET
ncbi:hypothetical protein P4O66_006831, partial [Electrophorus voltai]